MTPLRILSIATLFPDAARPSFGLFVEKSLRALAAQPGIELTVAAPLGLPPFPLSLHRRYRALRDLPVRQPAALHHAPRARKREPEVRAVLQGHAAVERARERGRASCATNARLFITNATVFEAAEFFGGARRRVSASKVCLIRG